MVNVLLIIAVALFALSYRGQEASTPDGVMSNQASTDPGVPSIPMPASALSVEPVEIGFDFYFLSNPLADPGIVLNELIRIENPEFTIKKAKPRWPLPDYTADLVLTAKSFTKSRVDSWSGDVPDVTNQITIAGGKHRTLWRSATHGMERFGYPDIASADHAASNLQTMGRLLNAIAQTLVERRALDGDGRLD
jgi:hypothetical protein